MRMRDLNNDVFFKSLEKVRYLLSVEKTACELLEQARETPLIDGVLRQLYWVQQAAEASGDRHALILAKRDLEVLLAFWLIERERSGQLILCDN